MKLECKCAIVLLPCGRMDDEPIAPSMPRDLHATGVDRYCPRRGAFHCFLLLPLNSLDRNAENDLCGTAIRIESKNHRTERPPLLPSRISPLGASWIGARRHERTGHTATYDPTARCYRTCAKNSAVSHADPGVGSSAPQWHKRRWRWWRRFRLRRRRSTGFGCFRFLRRRGAGCSPRCFFEAKGCM